MGWQAAAFAARHDFVSATHCATQLTNDSQDVPARGTRCAPARAHASTRRPARSSPTSSIRPVGRLRRVRSGMSVLVSTPPTSCAVTTAEYVCRFRRARPDRTLRAVVDEQPSPPSARRILSPADRSPSSSSTTSPWRFRPRSTLANTTGMSYHPRRNRALGGEAGALGTLESKISEDTAGGPVGWLRGTRCS